MTHDFGAVLSDGRELEHTFTLKNRTDTPVRLAESWRSSACCTAIGPIPEVVPSGSSFDVTVRLKTEGKSGPLSGVFSIVTTAPTRSEVILSVRARLFAATEVSIVEAPVDLAVAETGRGKAAIFQRVKLGGPEPEWPDLAGLATAYLDKAESRQIARDVVEWRRDALLVFDGKGAAGSRSGTIAMAWRDGRRLTRTHFWNVIPPITLVPSTIVLDRDKGPVAREFELRSRDKPFRLLSTEGELVVDGPENAGEARTEHRLRLTLDPGKSRGGLSEVHVVTDHPHAPAVRLSVLVPSSQPGGAPR
jgi:hypothetical protein